MAIAREKSHQPRAEAAEASRPDPTLLDQIARKTLWLSTAIVDAANHGRPNTSGVKVGGHQSSSASMVDIMTSLWFSELTRHDRVSVKPHASPVLHALNYLIGDLEPQFLTTLREKGGLQSYPSRLKDPDTVDFSTGSVGIGATAALWAAVAHRYASSHFASTPEAGRFISLLGDAELDEARGLQRDAGVWLASYKTRLAEEIGLAGCKVGYNSVYGYYIELTMVQARDYAEQIDRVALTL